MPRPPGASPGTSARRNHVTEAGAGLTAVESPPPELRRPPAGTEGQESQRGRDDDIVTVTEATDSQLLRHAFASGDPEVARLVRNLLDRPRPSTEAERRRLRRELTAWYGEDVDRNRAFVDFLEGLDRRRDAARRLPVICDDLPHSHALACRDPLAASG